MKKSILLVCLVLATFPFSRVIYFGGIRTINPYNIGVLLIFAVALIKITVKPNSNYGFNSIDMLVILFCVSTTLSTLLAEDLYESSTMALRAIYLPAMSYCALKALVEDEKDHDRVLYALSASIVVFAVIALPTYGITGTRTLIFEQSPVGAASLAVIPILFVAYSRWRKRILGVLSMVVSFLLLVITFSRVYYLLLLISPAIMRLIRRGHVVKIFIALFPATLIVTVLFTYGSTKYTHGRIKKGSKMTIERTYNIDLYKTAFNDRVDQYKVGMQEFYDNKLMGTGLKMIEGLISTHNFHIEWLQHLGIIGYAIGTGVFFSYFAIHRRWVGSDEWLPIYMCLVILVMMNCLTNGFMHGTRSSIIFMMMGIAEGRRKMIESV